MPHDVPGDIGNGLGRRLRRLREAQGLSRRSLADRLAVDVTSLAGWELGKYVPRVSHRKHLAAALGVSVDELFAETGGSEPPGTAALIDTLGDLPDLLEGLLADCRCLRALRIAAPYSTAANIQEEFRRQIGARLLAGTLDVHRIEIFYSLDRLKEGLSNVLRYNSRNYVLKAFRAAPEVGPSMGGYFFDESDFLIGAYWTGIPPTNQQGLHLSGEPFRTFFASYWNEIWRRGQFLNIKGAHDLSAIREIAAGLGLDASDWPQFVEEARTLEVGDGAPPLP